VGTTVHVYKRDWIFGYHLDKDENGEKRSLFGASHPDDVARELTGILCGWGVKELRLCTSDEASGLGHGLRLSADEICTIRQALTAEGFTVT